MHSISSLDKIHRTALLEGVAMLSRFYWGPDADGSRDTLRRIYLKPFEALKPIVSYEPPAIIDELKAINTSFAGEDELFQYLEQDYIRRGCL